MSLSGRLSSYCHISLLWSNIHVIFCPCLQTLDTYDKILVGKTDDQKLLTRLARDWLSSSSSLARNWLSSSSSLRRRALVLWASLRICTFPSMWYYANVHSAFLLLFILLHALYLLYLYVFVYVFNSCPFSFLVFIDFNLFVSITCFFGKGIFHFYTFSAFWNANS